MGYINVFYRWLKKQRLILPDVAALKMTPVVTVSGDDLTANPAINLEDWRLIWNEVLKRVNSYEREPRLHKSLYWWKTFYAFIMIAKNSGLRPTEMRKLTWRDVTLLNAGPRTKTDPREHIVAEINVRRTKIQSSSKTREPRQVPSKSGLSFRELKVFQQEYIDAHYGGYHQITQDDFVFTNYSRCEGKVVDSSQFRKAWTSANDAVRDKLKGLWASDNNYTPYSLKSSFVEDSLTNDIDCGIVALMTGHDVKVLFHHYQQLDGRRKTMELTQLPTGKQSERKNIIQFGDW